MIMRGIKYKIYKWCIKKLLKWSRIPGIGVYDIIYQLHKDDCREAFEVFNSIQIIPSTRISDDICMVDKDSVKIFKN